MKLYIFGGDGETINSYKWLTKPASRKYEVKYVEFRIREDSISDLRKFEIDKNSIVLGFSIGALVAYKLPVKVKLGIYCSISNILENDSEGREELFLKEFGQRTFDELKVMKYGSTKAEKFVIMCGDEEITPRDRIFEEKYGLTIIENTGHEFTEAYKEEVFKTLGIS